MNTLTPFKALSLALQANQTLKTPEECDAWAIRIAKHLAEKKRLIVSIPNCNGERTTLTRLPESQFWIVQGGDLAHAEIMLAAGQHYAAGHIV